MGMENERPAKWCDRGPFLFEIELGGQEPGEAMWSLFAFIEKENTSNTGSSSDELIY